MKKRILSLFLTIAMVVTGISALPVMAEEDIKVKINSTILNFDVPPQIINERTMVPLRAIFESLGASVDWNQDTKTVTSTKGDTTIKLTIDSHAMYVNGEDIALDSPACVVDGRTLVPVRAISEAFGTEVNWDGNTRTVNIVSKENYTVDKEDSQSNKDTNIASSDSDTFSNAYDVFKNEIMSKGKYDYINYRDSLKIGDAIFSIECYKDRIMLNFLNLKNMGSENKVYSMFCAIRNDSILGNQMPEISIGFPNYSAYAYASNQEIFIKNENITKQEEKRIKKYMLLGLRMFQNLLTTSGYKTNLRDFGIPTKRDASTAFDIFRKELMTKGAKIGDKTYVHVVNDGIGVGSCTYLYDSQEDEIILDEEDSAADLKCRLICVIAKEKDPQINARFEYSDGGVEYYTAHFSNGEIIQESGSDSPDHNLAIKEKIQICMHKHQYNLSNTDFDVFLEDFGISDELPEDYR